MTDRESYRQVAEKQLERNIYLHSLALEACMAGLYDYLSQNNRITVNDPPQEDWTLAGLIHDIDYSGDFKFLHPQKTKEVLSIYNLDIGETVHNIVLAHAPSLTGRHPQNLAEWSIFCADSLTGLIVATALVMPTKKLADVKLSSVLKRFLKEPKFAAGTRRDEVKQCEDLRGLNIPLDKFIEICLQSMQSVSSTLGL